MFRRQKDVKVVRTPYIGRKTTILQDVSVLSRHSYSRSPSSRHVPLRWRYAPVWKTMRIWMDCPAAQRLVQNIYIHSFIYWPVINQNCLQFEDRRSKTLLRRKGSPIPKGKFGRNRNLMQSKFGWYQVSVSTIFHLTPRICNCHKFTFILLLQFDNYSNSNNTRFNVK